jgi:hypothetical protein
MYPAFKMAVTLYDVPEPADPTIERAAIGGYDQAEMALVRGPDGWALDWSLLHQWPKEREYAEGPAALRAARATIQARLSTV